MDRKIFKLSMRGNIFYQILPFLKSDQRLGISGRNRFSFIPSMQGFGNNQARYIPRMVQSVETNDGHLSKRSVDELGIYI